MKLQNNARNQFDKILGVAFITDYDKYKFIRVGHSNIIYIVKGSLLLRLDENIIFGYINKYLEINNIYFQILSDNDECKYHFIKNNIFIEYPKYISLFMNKIKKFIEIRDKSIPIENIFTQEYEDIRYVYGYLDNNLYFLGENNCWNKIFDNVLQIKTPNIRQSNYYDKIIKFNDNKWYHMRSSDIFSLEISKAFTNTNSYVEFKHGNFYIIRDDNLELFTKNGVITYFNLNYVDEYIIYKNQDSIFLVFSFNSKLYILVPSKYNKKLPESDFELDDSLCKFSGTHQELYYMKNINTQNIKLYTRAYSLIILSTDNIYQISTEYSEEKILYHKKTNTYEKAYSNKLITVFSPKSNSSHIKYSDEIKIKDLLFMIVSNLRIDQNILLCFDYANSIDKKIVSSGNGVTDTIYVKILVKFFDEYITSDRVPKFNYSKLKKLDNRYNYLAVLVKLLVSYILKNKTGFHKLLPFNFYYHLLEEKNIPLNYMEKLAELYDKKYYNMLKPYANKPAELIELGGNFNTYEEYLLDIVGFDFNTENNLLCKKFAYIFNHYLKIHKIIIDNTMYDIISTLLYRKKMRVSDFIKKCNFLNWSVKSPNTESIIKKCITKLKSNEIKKLYYKITGLPNFDEDDEMITIKHEKINTKNISYYITTCSRVCIIDTKVKDEESFDIILKSIITDTTFNSA